MTHTDTAAFELTHTLHDAVAHHQAGRLQEAAHLYLAILQVMPQQPDAHYNLGILAMQAENTTAAVDHFRTALRANLSEGRYWLSTVSALIRDGQPDAARSLLAQGQKNGLSGNGVQALLLQLARPQKPERANVDRLLAAYQAGQHAQVAALARAMATNFPAFGLGWTLLAAALRRQGHIAEALTPSRKAAQLAPNDAQALCNLGSNLTLLGHLDEAEVHFQQALALKPDLLEAHHNRGINFFHLRLLALAEASFKRVIQLQPDMAEAHCWLGVIFNEMGRLDEARTHCRRAIELLPASADAHNALGVNFQNRGQFDEAEACYRQALAVQPGNPGTHHNLLYTLNYHPDKSAEEIFQAYRDFDTQIGLPQVAHQRRHHNHRATARRLKIGYVSPDFRRHAMQYFVEPVLAQHAKNAVEVYAYAELAVEDDVTARLRTHVDHWVQTMGMSDEAMAERIRDDGIDVLVDLAGHTANNRLPVFARKPAPVSLSWLGYGYTTGLTAIDYFLSDEVSAPPGSDNLFSEKPWRLPTTAYVYRPSADMGAVSPLPALAQGAITFGTLTRAVRINHRTVRVWAEILKRTPGSRLVINSQSYDETAVREDLRARFTAWGIEPERLHIGHTSPPWNVLRSLDIGLDCFPHNSGTTLFETLYMGVPYVTLAGRPSVGRIGSAILRGVGHTEWIAASEEDYIEKACALAADLPALTKIRANLRHQMQASPLMDEAGFTRRLEAAYQEMFALWATQPAPTGP